MTCRSSTTRDGSTTAEVQVADEAWVVHGVRPGVAVLSGPSTYLARAH